MHSDSLSLNLQSQYSINELIFINSGSNYYVRLPINKSAALFAGNNEGKTSSLSALKLFLLPEVNFKGSANKFNFSSGGTPFSDIASFQYYFPSPESYIICEAENPSHPNGFCWVLFKSTDYHYDRIAVPHSYNYIEHLFWNSSSINNEEIGALHEDISIKTIKDKLLSKQYGGKLITDKKMISEASYSRTTSQDDHTRFCLLPMVQKSSPDSVKTVRSLLDMAFDLSNASTKSLPIAIGSIIDSKGLSVVENDGIFLDLESKLDEWQTLQKQQKFLSQVEEQTPQWHRFEENLNTYIAKKSDTKVLFGQVSHYVNEASSLFTQESKSLKEQTDQHEKTLNIENQKLHKIQETITALSTRIEDAQENIQKINDALNEIETLKAHYAEKNIHFIEEIISDLKQREISISQNVLALQNDQETEKRLTELTREIKQKQSRLNALQSSLKNIQNKSSFLDQFSEHTSSVLFSLNEDFTSLTTTTSTDEKQIITEFTNLFKDQNGQLSLSNHAFSKITFKKYSDKDASLNLTKIIEELQAHITKLENDRLSLHQYSKASPQERQQNISKFEKDNEIIQSQLDNLMGETNLRKNLIDNQKKLDLNNDDLVLLKESQNSLQDQITYFKNQFHLSKSAYDKNAEKLKSIQDVNNTLNTLAFSNRGFLDNTPPTNTIITLKPINDYDPQYINSSTQNIKNNISSINELNNTILQSLRTFSEYNFIEMSPEEKHNVSLANSSFNTFYESLKKTFETLDIQKNSFYNRLQAHNNTVDTSISIINKIKGIIDDYIDGLNRQLSGYQISNLDNVTIDTTYHPQYTAAIKAMSKISQIHNNTYPQEMYDHLQAFQATFYVKSSKKIDIAKIIEKISYSFSRNEKKEDIPQSNGTNSMVNAILLAILFKSMIPEDLKLQLPVVFDEVGKLDEDNLNEIYKIVTEQNLILFVATPDPTGIIASVLDLYHDLSCFQAIDVTVYDKAKTIYFQGMEERLINLEL
ncbi:ATP-binding protein [Wohlfahrtiimonas populi]|uniref:ATP-binding protein n=1 Tax=Wohlfahrtiimonas populi TaxID=1940240 RepID=UPI00098D4DCA|nr:ATP-binding protein [Wohlfahrtiimonas populi]